MSPAATKPTGVVVEFPAPSGGISFGGVPFAHRSHPTGRSWRISKKGVLVVHDQVGNELARYKSGRWNVVWMES